MMHLVAYDTGDRHWHDLRTCEWRREDLRNEAACGGSQPKSGKEWGKQLRAVAKQARASAAEGSRGVVAGGPLVGPPLVGPSVGRRADQRRDAEDCPPKRSSQREDRPPERTWDRPAARSAGGAPTLSRASSSSSASTASAASTVFSGGVAASAKVASHKAKRSAGVAAARGAVGCSAATADLEEPLRRRREIATAQLSAVLLRASVDLGADAASMRQVAALIEAEVARTVPPEDYPSKIRSLTTNLQLSGNATLRKGVAEQSITPRQLVAMSKEDLAPESLKRQRAAAQEK